MNNVKRRKFKISFSVYPYGALFKQVSSPAWIITDWVLTFRFHYFVLGSCFLPEWLPKQFLSCSPFFFYSLQRRYASSFPSILHSCCIFIILFLFSFPPPSRNYISCCFDVSFIFEPPLTWILPFMQVCSYEDELKTTVWFSHNCANYAFFLFFFLFFFR